MHRCGENPRRQLVAPRGKRDVELALGTPVQLGGASGAGTAAPFRAAELDVEQPRGSELVEVEGGQRPRDTHGRARRIAAHRFGLGDDVAVERSPHRIVEDGDGGDVDVEAIHLLKLTGLDKLRTIAREWISNCTKRNAR